MTVQLEYFDHQAGQKRVISGSDPDYSMGQGVIWVSNVDPVAKLMYIYIYIYIYIYVYSVLLLIRYYPLNCVFSSENWDKIFMDFRIA